MKILTGKQSGPRKIMIYGPPGVGKSTWASQSPSPLFVNTEDSAKDIDVDKTEQIKMYSQAIDAYRYLLTEDHSYKTCVTDSIDWLESLLFDSVASEQGKATIADISFGRGYETAKTKLGGLIDIWDGLLNRGVGIILVAHSRIDKVEEPGQPVYDKYRPSLHKSIYPTLIEWCDEVLFASCRTYHSEEKDSIKKRAIGVGGTERFICTSNSAFAEAKNRLGLPHELPMPEVNGFAEYARLLRRPATQRPSVATSAFLPTGNETPSEKESRIKADAMGDEIMDILKIGGSENGILTEVDNNG